MMYAITNAKTFEKIIAMYKKIHKILKNTPVILVGTQWDLESQRKVSKEEATNLSIQLNIPIFETSSKNEFNVFDSVRTLISLIKMKYESTKKLTILNEKRLSKEEASIRKQKMKNASKTTKKQLTKEQVSTVIFGVSFIEVISRPNNKSDVVPDFMEDLCKYIVDHFLETEGIFRIPGSLNVITKLVQKLDKGITIDFAKEKLPAHESAGLLKQYIRQLPSPLFPTEFHDDLFTIASCKDNTTMLNLLSNVLVLLPIENFKFLEFFLGF